MEYLDAVVDKIQVVFDGDMRNCRILVVEKSKKSRCFAIEGGGQVECMYYYYRLTLIKAQARCKREATDLTKPLRNPITFTFKSPAIPLLGPNKLLFGVHLPGPGPRSITLFPRFMLHASLFAVSRLKSQCDSSKKTVPVRASKGGKAG